MPCQPNPSDRPSASAAGAPALDAFALLEASPLPVLVVGWDATVSYVNAATESLLGRRRAELEGRPGREAFPGNRDTVLGDALGDAIRTRTATALHAFVPPAGRWMEVDARPTPDGLAIFLRDLTGARSAQAALRESERWGSVVYDAASDAMLLLEAEAGGGLRVRSANAEFLRRTGRLRETTENRPLDDVLPLPAFARAHEKFAEAMRTRATVRYVDEIARPGTQRVVVEVTITPILDDATGRCTHLLSASRDVSERVLAEEDRRRLEGQLQQAQKMDAMGRLAGGVAHDFNNMLTAIKCNCELLLDDPSLGAEARADVGEVARTADRAAALTRQLLAFSRKQTLQPRVFDLNEVIGGVDRMLRRLIVDDVALATRPAPEPCRVRADAAQLEQVLVNLAVNARDAMPEGGLVTVATRRVRLERSMLHRHGTVPAGRWVVLEVTDSGTGMDEGTLDHLFEPFFTTKEQGKGTGLGLSTVYGIVSQFGGQVAVRSTLEQGSSFAVYLPEADGGADAPR